MHCGLGAEQLGTEQCGQHLSSHAIGRLQVAGTWTDRTDLSAGHGSQVQDLAGDEIDGKSETICPCDFKMVRALLLRVSLSIPKRAGRILRMPTLISARLA